METDITQLVRRLLTGEKLGPAHLDTRQDINVLRTSGATITIEAANGLATDTYTVAVLKGKFQQDRLGWVVWSNTDLTEGRGARIPIAVTLIAATAARLRKNQYVQGGDCPIEAVPLFWYRNMAYGPIGVVHPTAEDKRIQDKLDAKSRVLTRARELGLTESEIETLSSI